MGHPAWQARPAASPRRATTLAAWADRGADYWCEMEFTVKEGRATAALRAKHHPPAVSQSRLRPIAAARLSASAVPSHRTAWPLPRSPRWRRPLQRCRSILLANAAPSRCPTRTTSLVAAWHASPWGPFISPTPTPLLARPRHRGTDIIAAFPASCPAARSNSADAGANVAPHPDRIHCSNEDTVTLTSCLRREGWC